jgi:hypothetical protein
MNVDFFGPIVTAGIIRRNDSEILSGNCCSTWIGLHLPFRLLKHKEDRLGARHSQAELSWHCRDEAHVEQNTARNLITGMPARTLICALSEAKLRDFVQVVRYSRSHAQIRWRCRDRN